MAFARAAPAQARPENKSDTTSPSIAASYKIDDLGKFERVADDMNVSLNDDGTVAFWTRKTDGTVHATLWHSGQTTIVEDVPGYPNTIAHAINRHGDIAGWMNTSRNPVDSLSTTLGFVRHDGRIKKITGSAKVVVLRENADRLADRWLQARNRQHSTCERGHSMDH